MGDQTVANLTKKMLSEKVFHCAVCDNLLKLPVMIVENIGNVCNHCFEDKVKENEWKSLPNTNMNDILKELSFPCSFETEGCHVNALYGDLESHQIICTFRKINCLMPAGDCDWKGKVVDLLNHFKEEHFKHFLSSPYNVFSFEFNITKSTSIIKVLKKSDKNKAYILKIEEVNEDGSFIHFLRDINPTNEDVDMILKYTGKNGQHKVKTKRLSFNKPYNKSNGTKISLATLKEIADTSGNVTITIKANKFEMETINQQVQKHLECPICKELMRPPIRQCSTGHSVCNSCRPKLNDCPTCRQPWSTARNFSLEGLTPSVLYPCMYSQFGCEASFLGIEINRHEGICEFKMYKCPVTNCNFTGNYMSTKSHFKLSHAEDLIESTVYKANFVQNHTNNVVQTVKYFVDHGNIYRLTFKRKKDSCSWDIRVLNTYDTSNKYFYVICISDPRREQRKISKSNLCLSEGAEVRDDDGVSFSYNDLISYKNDKNNDQINYSCELHPKLEPV